MPNIFGVDSLFFSTGVRCLILIGLAYWFTPVKGLVGVALSFQAVKPACGKYMSMRRSEMVVTALIKGQVSFKVLKWIPIAYLCLLPWCEGKSSYMNLWRELYMKCTMTVTLCNPQKFFLMNQQHLILLIKFSQINGTRMP